MDAMVTSLTRSVIGAVKLKLFKGSARVVSRRSPVSLYDEGLASFGESGYDHGDAEGFIRLFSLPARVASKAAGGPGALTGGPKKGPEGWGGNGGNPWRGKGNGSGGVPVARERQTASTEADLSDNRP
jgi:hypothetical protein